MGGRDGDTEMMTPTNFSLCSSECLFCVQISEEKASLPFRMTYTLLVITFLKSLSVEEGGRFLEKCVCNLKHESLILSWD